MWEWIYCEQWMSMFYNDLTFDYLMCPTLVPAAQNLFMNSLLTPYVERQSDHCIHVDMVFIHDFSQYLLFFPCHFCTIFVVFSVNFCVNFVQYFWYFFYFCEYFFFLCNYLYHRQGLQIFSV